jgi:hypothetical protein
MEGYKMTMGRKLHTFSKARPSSMQELKVFKYSGGSTLWGDGRRCREQHNKNGEIILVSVPAKPKLKWLEHCVVTTLFGKYQSITKPVTLCWENKSKDEQVGTVKLVLRSELLMQIKRIIGTIVPVTSNNSSDFMLHSIFAVWNQLQMSSVCTKWLHLCPESLWTFTTHQKKQRFLLWNTQFQWSICLAVEREQILWISLNS